MTDNLRDSRIDRPQVRSLGAPGSVFRRRVKLALRDTSTPQSGEVRVALEDDFHNFRLSVTYRDGVVVGTAAEAPRAPYSACAAAERKLSLLRGMPLFSVPGAIFQYAETPIHCTHLLDLAGLAVRAAVRQTTRRQYDAAVPFRIAGRSPATLQRDGEPVLQWNVLESMLEGPAPFSGVSVRHGFAAWARRNLDAEANEAALLLRRCVIMSLGRMKDLDARATVMATGRCYAQQPDTAPSALRNVGSTWDFTNAEQALCRGDIDWLNFKTAPLP